MKAGEFKYPVEIFKKVKVQNEFNEEEENYVSVRKTKAAIKWKISASQSFNFEVITEHTAELLLRSYCEIEDNTRIMIQGKMYEVISYHEDLTYHDKVVEVSLVNT